MSGIDKADLELLNKICRQWNLGMPEYEPLPLKGGLMHKMFSLFTSRGKYAVKLLNPYVMKRETARDNFRIAEELEFMLEKSHIPILPALFFDGRKMQEIDGQFFYLYDWYEGKALKDQEIEEIHCVKIGKLLADIHGIDRRSERCERSKIHVDWDFYIEELKIRHEELYRLVAPNRDILYESQESGNRALKKLPEVISICHNDMDSKNVLWRGSDCRIIDLECLSFSSPYLELFEMALCWSGYETCNIDYNLFKKLIRSYLNAGGQRPADWETLYDSNYGRLEWLEYNIKRALGIECSEEEIEMGSSQVRETIAHVTYYYKERDAILNCLDKI